MNTYEEETLLPEDIEYIKTREYQEKICDSDVIEMICKSLAAYYKGNLRRVCKITLVSDCKKTYSLRAKATDTFTKKILNVKPKSVAQGGFKIKITKILSEELERINNLFLTYWSIGHIKELLRSRIDVNNPEIKRIIDLNCGLLVDDTQLSKVGYTKALAICSMLMNNLFYIKREYEGFIERCNTAANRLSSLYQESQIQLL